VDLLTDKQFWSAVWQTLGLIVHGALRAFSVLHISGGVSYLILLVGVLGCLATRLLSDPGRSLLSRRTYLRVGRGIRTVAVSAALLLVGVWWLAIGLHH
jgi:hypothetical protein